MRLSSHTLTWLGQPRRPGQDPQGKHYNLRQETDCCSGAAIAMYSKDIPASQMYKAKRFVQALTTGSRQYRTLCSFCRRKVMMSHGPWLRTATQFYEPPWSPKCEGSQVQPTFEFSTVMIVISETGATC
jgi:hypothetical protein